jgi:GT2 family glycosyltransferase
MPWVFLQAQSGRLTSIRSISLRFRDQNGTDLAPHVDLPVNRNGTLSEVLQIPPQTATVLLESNCKDSSIAFSNILLSEISLFERKLRLLDKVWRYAPQSLLQLPLSKRFSQLERLAALVRTARLERLQINAYEQLLKHIEPRESLHTHGSGHPPSSENSGPPVSFRILLQNDPLLPENALRSLAIQTYPHWEILSEASLPSDPDLPVWMLPLSSGDTLRRDALERMALHVQNTPKIRVLYSDHDFLSPTGQRHSPALKPGWNRDLFHSHNYLAHLCAFDAASSLALGIAPIDLRDEAHRYDLILRVADADPDSIHHLPQVLCHRGASPDATPTLGLPPQSEVLQKHLAAKRATVLPGPLPSTTRVLWPLPSPPPLVSIVVATRNQANLLRACVQSIQNLSTYPCWELLILDNQSSDPGTLSLLQSFPEDPRIRVLPYPKPFNYSALQNFGASHCSGSLIAFLNNDVEVIAPDWLESMVRHALRPEIGAVGARLLYTDGRIQHAGVALGIGGGAGHLHRFFPGDAPGYCGRIQLPHQLIAVTAACLLIRKSVFEEVRGFDEATFPVAFNDLDLCLKLHARGLRNLYEPRALLSHHESISRGPDDTPQKRRIFERESRAFRKRWPQWIHRDPFYHPNLTREAEDLAPRSE